MVRRRNRGECVLAVFKETFDDVSSRRADRRPKNQGVDRNRKVEGEEIAEAVEADLKLVARYSD